MNYKRMFYGNQYKEVSRMSFIQKAGKVSRRVLMFSAKTAVVAWLVVGGMVYVKKFHPEVVYAEKEVKVEVSKAAPVMERIAKCESGGKHIDPKTGQVYALANTNKTVDIGKYMINTVWAKKASELGFDLTKEEDNEKMAYYIYENFGTEAWVYSKHCWNK